MKDQLRSIVNFLFEIGTLARVPRSGLQSFLGNYKQSVAEHMHRTAYIGYVLAKTEGDPEIDSGKVTQMCLMHDMAEARTSDLNWINQKYVTSDEEKAIHDMTAPLPFGDDLKGIIEEYEERKSKESILAKDADSLELLLTLKEMIDIGHSKAKTWIPPLMKRLQTKSAYALAQKILETESDDWWYGNKEDEYWINRKGAKKQA